MESITKCTLEPLQFLCSWSRTVTENEVDRKRLARTQDVGRIAQSADIFHIFETLSRDRLESSFNNLYINVNME